MALVSGQPSVAHSLPPCENCLLKQGEKKKKEKWIIIRICVISFPVGGRCNRLDLYRTRRDSIIIVERDLFQGHFTPNVSTSPSFLSFYRSDHFQLSPTITLSRPLFFSFLFFFGFYRWIMHNVSQVTLSRRRLFKVHALFTPPPLEMIERGNKFPRNEESYSRRQALSLSTLTPLKFVLAFLKNLSNETWTRVFENR